MRLPDFELERFFARWEFEVAHVVCASDAETWSISELLEAADPETVEMWEGLRLGYTESAGHPHLRAEIAALYASADADDVVVFSGAEEAIFALINVLCGPGDHAVCVWPAYQSLHEVARAAGADLTLVRLRHEEGWALDVEEVERAVTSRTTAIVVNFPHSPTGALIGRRDLSRLVAIAEESGAHLVSDEVYRLMEIDEEERLPAGVDASPSTVSIGVLSKAWGLAGLRIGWVATRDRDLLRRVAAFKDYTTICASAPSEVLAITALRSRDRLLARNRSLMVDNLRLLDAFFQRHADHLEWVRPRSGTVGFPRLDVGRPIGEVAEDLARRVGVLILPGDVFDYPGNHFRLGFGRRNLAPALDLFGRYLAE